MLNREPTLTLARGRLLIIIATLLWSLGGAFTKTLTMPTWFGVDEPPIATLHWLGKDFPVQIASYRVLFAALFLVPMLKPREIRVRPLVLVMAGCFAVMNLLFISAQAIGSAANAILLQATAPLWMYFVSVTFLGESSDRRGLIALLAGLLGIVVIVGGGWHDGELPIVLLALGSGVCLAAVILCLRLLRGMSPIWLTIVNHGVGGLVLVPLMLSLSPPTWTQFAVLFLFGAVQMGLPYALVARALSAVPPAEAGTLMLFEPILNPVWVYLVCGETPSGWTFVGGAIILAALVWRYWPWANLTRTTNSRGGNGTDKTTSG